MIRSRSIFLERSKITGCSFALTGDDAIVTHVSENIESQYGVAVKDVLGATLKQIVHPDLHEKLFTILEDGDRSKANPVSVILVLAGRELVFDGITHKTGDFIILELENPRTPREAVIPKSLSSDNHFQLIERSLTLPMEGHDVSSFAEFIASEIRGFTGFDRVMVYRFDEEYNGEVIGESKIEKLEPFLGLNYPATDIPAQARALYLRNRLRLLHDVHSDAVAVVAAPTEGSDKPLDLSLAVLRSLSPIHIQYMKNMGVDATMTISLIDRGRLWGLISCHHSSGALFVQYAVRSACALYGIAISREIAGLERAIKANKANALREQINAMMLEITATPDILDSLSKNTELLMNLVDADGIAIIGEESIVTDGMVPPDDVTKELAEINIEGKSDGIFITDCAHEDIPNTAIPAEFGGVITIDLVQDWNLVFYRKATTLTTRWGGNPTKTKEPLTPRASFAEWVEKVEGHCIPWSEAAVTVLSDLRRSLSTLVFDRNRELKTVNEALKEKNAEVEQFVYTVSHDLKSPLVTCSGFVGMLTDDLAAEDKAGATDSLMRIQRSINLMSELIDEMLAYSKLGNHGRAPAVVEMNEMFSQIYEEFAPRFVKSGAELTMPEGAAPLFGHRNDIRRCFENLLWNALKYACTEPGTKVVVTEQHSKSGTAYEVKDDGPGIDPRYHHKIFLLFNRGPQTGEGTGVGLASVSKIMIQHAGSVDLKSNLGEGACFRLKFPPKPTAV